jgi:hypothetical protein
MVGLFYLTLFCSELQTEPYSVYNDGKGIRFVVTWTPLPPPPKSSQKRRKNGKPASQNIVVYIHKSATLHTCLANIFESLSPIPDLEYRWTGPFNARRVETQMFTTHVTIARSSYKIIQLETQEVYRELLDQVTAKGNPEIKLTIVKCKVQI